MNLLRTSIIINFELNNLFNKTIFNISLINYSNFYDNLLKDKDKKVKISYKDFK